MMVTYVRGHFKDVHGTLTFDPAAPRGSSVEVTIDTRGLWSGEPDRDAHLRGPDFFDVDRFPEILFASTAVDLLSRHEARVSGALTIRSITKPVVLEVRYLGQWETPWFEDGVDKGPKTRAGFSGKAQIDRRDFGVS